MTNSTLELSIAEQNDLFRQKGATPTLRGTTVASMGVLSLNLQQFDELLSAVKDYCSFETDNDPSGEHDFGSITAFGEVWFWKIDYYSDEDCQYGSDDPGDPKKVFRVLTIMNSSEY